MTYQVSGSDEFVLEGHSLEVRLIQFCEDITKKDYILYSIFVQGNLLCLLFSRFFSCAWSPTDSLLAVGWV